MLIRAVPVLGRLRPNAECGNVRHVCECVDACPSGSNLFDNRRFKEFQEKVKTLRHRKDLKTSR